MCGVVVGYRQRRRSNNVALRSWKEEAGRAISHGMFLVGLLEEETAAMSCWSRYFGK